jgi:hypothetical protein
LIPRKDRPPCRRFRRGQGRFRDDHPDIVIDNIILDKILFIEFKIKSTRLFRPEDKALTLRVQTAGNIGDSPPGPEIPKVHPAGPPKGNLHDLTGFHGDGPG